MPPSRSERGRRASADVSLRGFQLINRTQSSGLYATQSERSPAGVMPGVRLVLGVVGSALGTPSVRFADSSLGEGAFWGGGLGVTVGAAGERPLSQPVG